MPFTVIVSVMEKNMTADDTVKQFDKKVSFAVQNGWEPYGEVLYWANAMTQVLISDPIDLETSKPEIEKALQGGSRNPIQMRHFFGGRGHMGEKHWY